MEITVNNQSTTISDGNTLSDLIQQLGLNEKRIAIEYNRNILSREQFASIILQADDNIEIVNLVGGG
ncbi:MAG: sulfur carrier protein ThiS [Thermodesulfobacteriota bacterium]|nr:sulfur carrier protein ThiS [Thermodesulfobacteriota bacterium]